MSPTTCLPIWNRAYKQVLRYEDATIPLNGRTVPIVQRHQVDPRRDVIQDLVVQLHKPRLAHSYQRHIYVGVGQHIVEQEAPHVQHIDFWEDIGH